MFRKVFIIMLLVFLFILNYNGVVYSLDKSKNKNKEKRKSSERIDKLEKKINGLQKQLMFLQGELEKIKKERAGKLSPAETSKPPMDDDEALLKKLQEEAKLDKDKESLRVSSGKQTGNVFNPDISVNADFIWQLNHNKKVDGGNPFRLSELELAFKGKVDPWSSLNAFIGMHQHGDETHIHIEEAYANLHKLPLEFQLKAGKFYTYFGKDNKTHHHARPYVDVPTFVRNYLGEEGISGTGFSLRKVIPIGNIFGEAVIEAFNDENSLTFSGGKSGKPIYNGHFRLYTDLSDSSNIEIGYSHLRGFNNEAANRLTKIQGMDLTYRWRPVKRGKYNSMLLRGEYLWSDRENAERQVKTEGYYALAQYQMNRNWYVGARYDYSGFPNLINSHEKSISGILTYRPTEFSFYRLQYKNTKSNFKKSRNEWWFQMNWTIGPHGAHGY